MNLPYEHIDPIEFNLSQVLRRMNLKQENISDAILVIREFGNKNQLDEDAPVSLKLNEGLTWSIDGRKLYAEIPLSNWANLSIGGKYEWRIGIKVNGNEKFSELDTRPNIINVVQDFIRG